MLTVLTFAGSALATTKDWTTTAYETLAHGTDYTWSVDSSWGIPTGEHITSATLSIAGLNNSAEPESDSLNIYLLNNPYTNWPTKTLLTVFQDTNGYYWKDSLGVTHFTNPSETLNYNLTTAQLVDLTTYISDNTFGLGFDPNCHYSNTGITFSIVTEKNPVSTPEPTSLLLLGLGLLGLAGTRRKINK